MKQNPKQFYCYYKYYWVCCKVEKFEKVFKKSWFAEKKKKKKTLNQEYCQRIEEKIKTF